MKPKKTKKVIDPDDYLSGRLVKKLIREARKEGHEEGYDEGFEDGLGALKDERYGC